MTAIATTEATVSGYIIVKGATRNGHPCYGVKRTFELVGSPADTIVYVARTRKTCQARLDKLTQGPTNPLALRHFESLVCI